MPIMDEFLEATPTAELLPLSAGVQSDEEVSPPSFAAFDEPLS
jgi:NH3-dependent NAD+ synthetase